MASEVALEVLESERWGNEVDKLAKGGRAIGIAHVPTFEIGGKIIEGAEDLEEFYEAFVRAREAGSGDECRVNLRT